jgi:hypothetical protein
MLTNIDDLGSKLQQLIDDGALRGQMGNAARATCESYLNVERLLHNFVHTVDLGRD